MKKKISSVLLSMFVLLVCLFASACGDKYKNMEFKISYAYAADSEEWHDASEGILLNYGGDDDLLVFDSQSQTATIYLKVEIENVKSKHIDSITVGAVSSAGLDFTTANVKEGEVVPVQISGNVKTTLNFYENNSKKSTSLDFSVYRSLTGIEVDTSIKPAFNASGFVSLLQIENLTYLPYGQTNQTGVTYSVESIGYNNAGNYVATISNVERYLEVSNALLRVKDASFISSAAYAIRVKATSVFDEEISAFFDVYVEKNDAYTPVIKFDTSLTDTVNNIDLSKNSANAYESTYIYVDPTEIPGVYKEERETQDGSLVSYKTQILVDGVVYNLDENSSGINGLVVTKENVVGNIEVYKVTLSDTAIKTNTLQVRYALEGFNFDFSSEEHYYERSIQVTKHLLPNTITINGQEFAHGQTGNDVVYSVNKATYNGLALTLNANPTNDNNTKLSITGAENLTVRYKDGTDVDLSNIKNGATVYIKFKSGVNNDQTISIRSRNTPTTYNDEAVAEGNMSISYTLTKSVTASEVKAYVNSTGTVEASKTSSSSRETNFIIDAIDGGYLYLDLNYQGSLDKKSIKVYSSNPNVTFADGSTEIDFDSSSVMGPVSSVGSWFRYRVALKSLAADETSVISVEAANGYVGTNTSATVLTRNTLSLADLSLLHIGADNNRVTVVNEDKKYFAIPNGELAAFALTINNDDTGIYDVDVTSSSQSLQTIVETSNSKFSITARKTASTDRTVNAEITYYQHNGSYFAKATRNYEFEVVGYDAIGVIAASNEGENDKIAYVNEIFEDAATALYEVNSYSAGYGSPSTEIEFTEETISDVSRMAVSVSPEIFDCLGNGINIFFIDEYDNITNIDKDFIEDHDGILSILSGTFKVQLTRDGLGLNEVAITLTAYRFDRASSVSTTINIPIAEVERAEGIVVSGEKIISYSDMNREIQLSFLESPNYAQATFTTSLVYSKAQQTGTIRYDVVNENNMAYLIYKYQLNEDGEIETNAQGEPKLTEQLAERLDVIFNNGEVSVGSYSAAAGGLFKLVIASKDSYTIDPSYVYGYKNVFELDVRISDGSKQNKYVIDSAEDINKINSDPENLKSFYVLGADVAYSGEPIGLCNGTVVAFTGGFSGKLVTSGTTNYYSLSYSIENGNYAQDTTYGDMYGLFAHIGTNGKVSDLTLQVEIDSISSSSTAGLNIAGLVTLNEGTISNVKVETLSVQNVEITASSNVNFGLIAAINNNKIEYSVVESEYAMNLKLKSTRNYNIGMVAGINSNNGIVEGSYEGKSSLNSLVFDVIVNLNIVAEANAVIKVGAVAGENTKDVSNMLVSGRIVVDNINLSGRVGGIVGYNAQNITTVGALGLDIKSSSNVVAAGIAAETTGTSKIEDAKFISAQVNNKVVGNTNGTIEGDGEVAGIAIGAGSIEKSSVESFVNQSNFYTLNGATVYGLAKDATNIITSFVNANVYSTGTTYLVANTTTTDTYFIGAAGSNVSAANATYAIVLSLTSDNSVTGADAYIGGTKQTSFSLDNYIDTDTLKTTEWNNFVATLADFSSGTNWKVAETYNTVQYGKVVFYFPYLEVAGNVLMIERPTSIATAANEDYIVNAEAVILKPFTLNSMFREADIAVGESVSGLYELELGSYNLTTDTVAQTGKKYYKSLVSETMVVNYYYALNKTLAEIRLANTHKLYTTGAGAEDQGLIDLTIFPDPDSAQGGIQFETIGESFEYASINSNDETITFLKLSGNTPIIIRAYSIFNTEVESYYVFYTQMLANRLVLSSSIVQQNGANYIGSLRTGQDAQLIMLSAENIYKGNYYQTIFDYNGIESFLNLTATTSSVLDINTSNPANISVAIKDDAIFNSGDVVTITFALSLLNDYFADANVNELPIGEVTVEFTLYKSASSVVVETDSSYIVSSNEAIHLTASLYTGYVANDDLINRKETLYRSGNEWKITLDPLEPEDARDVIVLRFASEDVASKLNIVIKTTSIKDVLDPDKCLGYKYDITISLKDEFSARYLTSNMDVDIEIIADSDATVNDSISVTFKPTNVSTARIENYAVTSIDVKNEYQNLISTENIETALIDPNSKGAVMIIYLEPSYAHVTSASLTTSTANIPSLGREVGLYFTQLVYDAQSRRYVTLAGSEAHYQQGNTLELSLVSTVNGTSEYSGVIYVHVQVEKFKGKEVDFTATLNVKTGSNEEIEVVKNLTTSYLPSVDLEFNGMKQDDKNLVQKGTYSNLAQIELYGYQFNANPTVSVEWYLPEGSAYRYVDGKTYQIALLEDVDFNNGKYDLKDGRTALLIGDYVTAFLGRDYSDVEFSETTESYLMDVLFNVSNNIVAPFKIVVNLSLIDKNSQTVSDSDYLVFYPTDYILTGVTVSNINNNNKNLVIGTNTKLDFGFTTENSLADLSDNIYNKLFSNPASEEELENLASLFYYFNNGQQQRFSLEEGAHTGFDVAITESNSVYYVTLIGKANFSNTIYLKLNYKYQIDNNGVYTLEFVEDGTHYVEYAFTLNIMFATTKDNAYPIYDASDMFDSNGNCILVPGSYNILMNDIVLENIHPIDLSAETLGGIANLDGNNKVIKIKSFAIDVEESNYGLFGKFGTYKDVDGITRQSLLENVVVDYSEFMPNGGGLQFTNIDELTNITFGGLVARNDNGLIYNCDVVNMDATKEAIVEILFDDEDTVTFGGLVGINSGVITNSRVGRSTFTKITADSRTESSVVYNTGLLSFVLGNDSASTNKFNITAGGFVGKNSGIISNSYVNNTSVINYSTNEATNITAGFTGVNDAAASISYSYVKASDTLNEDGARYTGTIIENKGNGIVAGFVYDNSGYVSNSYSNTVLQTKSAYIAGFVYKNGQTATVRESYAACTMNSGISNTYAEQPFSGVDNEGTSQSQGLLENVYYLLSSDSSDKDAGGATPLNIGNFANSENLNGFVFVLSNSKAEREQSVWSYYDINSERHSLPVLISADTISHSYRYIVSSTETTHTYRNSPSYELGSKNNPYTISNVEEFNRAFVTYNAPYVRFINNVDFNSDETAIQTRLNYTLKASIEGNGMTVSGIYFDVSESIISEVGLFATVESSYIKNLNLNFAQPKTENQFSTTTVNYSGGLAGKINNSVILNIKLDGKNTTLTGKNFVGGLAGIITGRSLLYGIETNLSVKAGSTSEGLYYSLTDYVNLEKGTESNYETYLRTLSYAGGIAGVIDIQTRSAIQSDEFNVSYIYVRGDEMAIKTKNEAQEANIVASYVGGVAGYASEETNSLRLKYYTGAAEIIRGTYAAGGIYGVSLGDITASQVTAEEDSQYLYDTTLGQYVMAFENDPTADPSEDASAGNLHLIESYGYAGGLVGVAIGVKAHASYSKASFSSGLVIGGLFGTSVASSVTYSYAVPYVDIASVISKNVDTTQPVLAGEKQVYIGGLIGSAYSVANGQENRNLKVLNYAELVDVSVIETESTDIQFTFSTVLMNNKDLSAVTTAEQNLIDIDYVCSDYEEATLTSNANSTYLSYVFAGKIEYTLNIVSNKNKTRNSEISMYTLYNTDSSEQDIEFNTVFSGWSIIKYWSLNEDKYFPLLIKDKPVNYIEIAISGDFDKLRANPSGNYKIVNNITIPTIDDNWVFNVNFTGVLIGDLENSDEKPVVTIQGLQPTIEKETSGLFKQTTGAEINNLTFVWGGAIDISTTNDAAAISELDMIAGLSCQDSGSAFSNVDVYVNGEAGSNELLSMDADDTIIGFGGLLGSSENSNIMSCRFTGSVTANLSATSTTDVYFGAVAAKALGKDNVLTEEKENMSVMNVIVSSATTERSPLYTISQAQFRLTLDEYKTAYIGGLIGYANNVAVSGNKVGSTAAGIDGYKDIALNVTASSNYVYIGGLAGYAVDSATSKNDVLTDMVIAGGNNGSETKISVGGLYGLYHVSTATTEETVAVLEAEEESRASVSGIKTSNAMTNIKFTAAAAQAHISAGVAEASGVVNIEQCLFTGDIINKYDSNPEEDGLESSNVTTVYAGGVVGSTGFSEEITVNNLTLREVMSTANLTVGNERTTTLYAGGLVGYSSERLDISSSVTSGKIVPYGVATSVGGILGVAAGVTNVSYSYSTTSIVAGSVNDESIATNTINAIVGTVSANTVVENSVYYSSDIALAPEDNNIGTNLVANLLWYGNEWHNLTDGSNEGIMQETEGSLFSSLSSDESNARLPYITSLRTALENYGVIFQNDYLEGTSLCPVRVLTDSNIVLEESYRNRQGKDISYTYYLIEGLNTKVTFDGKLNGIIVGTESAYNPNILNVEEDEGTNYQGLIPIVDQDSAVSNIHLNISSKDISGVVGFIVGLNKGVVFNSSVQGNGIELDEAGSSVGIIVGKNQGLVSYSYSTAEIKTANLSNLGGIAYMNSGKLMSNYFTGYLGNTNMQDPAAGISVTGKTAGIFAEGDAGIGTGYSYNNYMAGVVASYICRVDDETPDDNFNSFTMAGIDFNGSNNYVDEYANCECYLLDNLKSQRTYNLMANISKIDSSPLLLGNWYSAVRSGEGSMGTDLDMEKYSYGFNYNYPVYKFNKNSINDSGFKCQDINNQAYTGYGATKEEGAGVITWNNAAELVGDVSLEARRNAIDTTDSKVYEDALKIPHLGVLSSIQGLLSQDLNYVLIYSSCYPTLAIPGVVELGEFFSTWTPVGDMSSESTNGFVAANGFNGLFVGNAYFDYTETDNKVHVANFEEYGLFANINNAYISNFTVAGANIAEEGSFRKINNSGVIGTNVVGDTYIEDVDFVSGLEFKSANFANNYYGAMFGSITGGSVIISGVEADRIILTGNVENTFAGFVAGQMTGGSLKFLSGAGLDSTINVEFGDNLYAGGLIGYMSGGSINTIGDEEVEEVLPATEDPAPVDPDPDVPVVIADNYFVAISVSTSSYVSNLGGLIGTTTNDVSIARATASISGTEIKANNFGGITADNSAHLSVTGASVSGSAEISFYGNKKDDRYFGLVAGVNSGKIELDGVNLSIAKIKVVVSEASAKNFDENTTDQGVGLFIGNQKAGSLTGANASNVTLEVVGVANVGGAIGYFGKADEAIGAQLSGIIIRGTTNVGGIIGYSAGALESGEDPLIAEELLKASDSFATIEIVESGISGQAVYNVGGLFGKLSSAITTIEIINNNEITFNSDPGAIASLDQQYAYNVGGIAGKYVGPGITANLTNKANILLAVDNIIASGDPTDPVRYLQNTDEEGNLLVRAVNVGGVFGCVDDSGRIEVAPLEEEPEAPEAEKIPVLVRGLTCSPDENIQIMGYQNIGGIIGKVKGNVQVQGSNSLEDNVEVTLDGHSLKTTIEGTDTDLNTIAPNVSSMVAVKGVLSAGGAIGYVTGDAIISNISTFASVFGNASVGGVVATTIGEGETIPTIKLNYISTQESGSYDGSVDDTSTEVKGLYFKNGSEVYLPTSVGGFVGTSVSSIIEQNYMKNVYISSSEEGSAGELDTVIKTTKNYIFDINIGLGDKSNLISESDGGEDVSYDLQGSVVDFDNIQSGFGGFIGSLDYETMNRYKDEGTEFDQYYLTTNHIVNIKINASLGVNVGTYYGFYVAAGEISVGGTNIMHVAPELDATKSESVTINGTSKSKQLIYIDGAYNIGGIIGYIKGEEIKQTTNESDGSGDQLTGNALILLQHEVEGVYVGGLYGKVSSGDELNSTAKVENLNIQSDQNISIVIDTSKSFYMGGLVGRYEGASFTGNVGDGDNNDEITTSTRSTASAKYESAENFGALIGLLKVPKQSGGATVQIGGEHYYSFTINTIENVNYVDGATRYVVNTEQDSGYNFYAQAYYVNQDQFSIQGTSNTDVYGSSKYSPLNNQVYGWPKEYTGFRSIQRCIPAGAETGGTEWDAVTNIYDASRIKYVQIDGTGFIKITVYEEESGLPKAYGVVGSKGAVSESYVASMLFNYNRNSFTYRYDSYKDSEDPDVDLEKPSDYSDLGNSKYDLYIGLCNAGYTDMFAQAEQRLIGIRYLDKDKQTFVKDKLITTGTTGTPSTSGSIFEVNGYSANTNVTINQTDEQDIPWWKWIIGGLAFIGGILAAVYTGGVGFFAGLAIAGAIIGGAALLLSAVMDSVQQNTISSANFLQTVNQGEGYLSSSYAKYIYYDENGYATNETDDFITINSQTFQPYSYDRPVDFDTHRYSLYKVSGLSGTTIGGLDTTEIPVSVQDLQDNYETVAGGPFTYTDGDGNTSTYEAMVKKGGEYYIKLDYYIYYEEAYWINIIASKTKQRPTSDLFKPQTSAETERWFYNTHEGNYVYGSFNSSGYSYLDTIEDSAGVSYTNYMNANGTVNYGTGNLSISGVPFTQGKDIYFTRVSNGTVSGKEGYDKITTGAFYTKDNAGHAATNQYLEYVYDAAASGNIGYDYIEETYYVSAQSDTGLYYYDNGFYPIYERDGTDYYNNGTEKVVTNNGNRYSTNAFTKPEKAKFKLNNITTQAADYDAAAQRQGVLGTTAAAGSFSKSNTDKLYYQAYTSHLVNPYSATYAFVQENSSLYDYKAVDAGGEYCLNAQYFLFIGGFKVKTVDGQLKVYTKNESIMGDGTEENNDASLDEALGASGLGADDYIKDNGVVYIKNDRYSILSSGEFANIPVRNYLTYNQEDEEQYNFGKILTNGTVKLYTRYKYDSNLTGKKWLEDGKAGSTVKSPYILVPTGKTHGHPNGVTSYLVESVKVCLGGGGTSTSVITTLTSDAGLQSSASTGFILVT